MPHHGGIIGEIEDGIIEIEQLALSGGGLGGLGGMRQQPVMVMQQPMGYGQGMYGAYGSPMNTVQYAQPAYATRSAYAVQPAPVAYGPAYAEAPPAMVFGGAYEGATPVAYQQPVYQAQPQGYAQVPQPAYAQRNLQPAYAQAPPPLPQYATPQAPQQPQYAAAQAPQQPQYAQYATPSVSTQAPQPSQPPQYAAAQAPQAASPPQFAATQAVPTAPAPPQPTVAQAMPPAPQYDPNTQSSPPQYAQVPQPATQYPPSQTGGQPAQIAQTQAPPQATSQYPPASQPSPQPQYASQYPPESQRSMQPQYAPQPSPEPQYLSGQPPPYTQVSVDPQSGLRSAAVVVAAAGAATGVAAVGYAAYERYQHAPTQQQQVPSRLSWQDTVVRFEPVSAKMGHNATHHHVMKLLSHSRHNVPELSQIIGTYLMAKHNDGGLVFGMSASRPEVKQYYHEMDKLEKLSADYVKHHSSSTQQWKEALGPHRRQVFAELYNSNELVRAFCQEMRGGPLALPDLDSYSLGAKLSSLNFARSAKQQPNLCASFSLLQRVRTVVLVDDSYSMTEPGHASWSFARSESRWMQTRNILAGIVPLVAAQSPYGLDLHFLNRTPFYAGLRTAGAAHAAFDADSPNNGTPTGARVNDILDAYVSTLRYYRSLLPLNLIVITDGEAQDEDVLHRAIEHHVTEVVHRGFPAHQFGAEFVQVGDCKHATRHLERLENEVSRHHHRFQRDVVGVTPANRINNMDPQGLLAIALSGVDARLNGYMRSRGVNV